MTQDTQKNGQGIVKRLVGRVRSTSRPSTSPPSPSAHTHPATPDTEKPDPMATAPSATITPSTTTTTTTTTTHSTHHHKPRRLATFSLPSSTTFSRRGTATSSHKSSHKSSPAADLSLSLWNAAYDALRTTPKTFSLVTAYEAIISNELPESKKSGNLGINAGSALSEAAGDTPRRLELIQSIALNGLTKRRGSDNSNADEAVRGMLNEVKGLVEGVMGEFPSAAMAWAGVCTMTPLLLEPILSKPSIKDGLLHIAGRIPWYMQLASVLDSLGPRHGTSKPGGGPPSSSSPRSSQVLTPTSLTLLYRKVLEFEMNCVCATASTWNNMAKHVVDWSGLDGLVEEIARLDDEMGKVVRGCGRTDVEAWDRDLAFGPTREEDEGERTGGASLQPGPTVAAAAAAAAAAPKA